MKLFYFLGAIGLILGATTNVHGIKPNVLKSQNRQVQRANQEYFDIESEYSITMGNIQSNVFNTYDYVVFDLQNGELWQTDTYSVISSWVQLDITNSYQALHFDDYHNYLISRGANYDYVELDFKFSLGSQSQYQDNYIGAVLFTFDENNNFVEIANDTFNNLSPINTSYTTRIECLFEIVGELSLDNLYLAFEYYSPDKSVGNIKVSVDTDIYLENESAGEMVTDILNNKYNYFIFSNNLASLDIYHQAYNDGYRVGFNESKAEIDGLKQDIAELSRQLELTEQSAQTLHDLWQEAEQKLASATGLQSVWDWFGSVFDTMANVLDLEIAPNIKLSYLLAIPIIVGALFFIVKVLKVGS